MKQAFKIIIVGGICISINRNIVDAAAWMIPYFQGGYDEAKQYTTGSNKHIFFKCPDCENVREKSRTICDLYRKHSIGCECRDRKSYPEKFMKNLLVQLNTEHTWGFRASWLKGYNGSKASAVFDFYLPNFNIMIEMDGELGHGKKTFQCKGDVAETLNKDKWKDARACEQGISVIRIDSDKSTIEYLREQIEKELSSIIDLSSVDWISCGEFATKNIAKVVCKYYEQDKSVGIMALSRYFSLDKATIRKYLKMGRIFGWCTYEKEESLHYREINKLKFHNERHAGFVKEICEYYEKNKPISTADIAKTFNIHISSALRWLTEGQKQGISTYTPESARALRNKKVAKMAQDRQNRKVSIFKDGKFLGEYASAVELCKCSQKDFGMQFTSSCIYQVAKGKSKQHKGYTFKNVM